MVEPMNGTQWNTIGGSERSPGSWRALSISGRPRKLRLHTSWRATVIRTARSGASSAAHRTSHGVDMEANGTDAAHTTLSRDILERLVDGVEGVQALWRE